MAAMEGPDHTIVAANAAFRAFTGQPDPIGQPARQVFPSLPQQRIGDLLDLVYAAGEPFTAREWPADEDRYLDVTIAPWPGAGGGVRGVLVTQADVTEQVRQRRSPRPPPLAPSPAQEAAAVQEALLPSGLPVLPQARIAARYLPADVKEAAGGDWFDAFPLSGGRVALMVGDVAGDGMAATAAMGRLRAVLGQALTLQSDLAVVLTLADRFAAHDPALHAATVCVAVLDLADGRLRYATCGHPAPIVASVDGTARHLPGTGAGPLGTTAGPLLADAVADGLTGPAGMTSSPGSAVLGLGEVLLMYSDGLVERPGRTLTAGQADLEIVAGDAAANPALAAWPAGTPAERVSHLTVELLTQAGHRDDVTTLAVWRQPIPDAPLDLECPANPDAVATLRQALDDWLKALGVAFGDRQLAELSVVEVVTNAVEHAYPYGRPGPVRLQAMVGADGWLESRVSDRGRWRAPDFTEADRGQGLSAATQFAEELLVSHPPQDASEPRGARGTVVAMRHRLHRRPMITPRVVGVSSELETFPPFAVELVAAGPVPRVRVSGPVDFATAGRMAGRLLVACRAGVLPLTVDLSGVTVLASAGVTVLYRVQAQLAAHDQELTLISEPGSPAAAVLDLAQLPRSPR